jgi:tetratricopeptide (TPR) repeat protein
MAGLAYEQAAAWYGMALDALVSEPSSGLDRRADLLLARGDAWRRSGDVEAARRAYLAAADIARCLDDASTLARAALGVGESAAVWGLDEQLVGLLEETLAVVGDRDPVLRGQLLARLAQALYYSEPERRLELSGQAVDEARRAGQPAALAAVLCARRVTLSGPDDLTGRLEAATEAVRLAELAGEADLAARGYAWIMIDRLEAGDGVGAWQAMAAHRQLAEDLRQPMHLRDAAVFRTMKALLEGRFADAKREAADARTVGERAGDADPEMTYMAHRVGAAYDEHDIRTLARAAEMFAERARAFPWVPGYPSAVAWMYASIGRKKEARSALEQLTPGSIRELPRDAVWLVNMTNLVRACAALGDVQRATVLYDLLGPYDGRVVVVDRGWVCFGTTSHHLGVLAALLGHLDAAEGYFQSALALEEGLGARPQLTRSWLEYARVLFRRDASSDAERVGVFAAQAASEGEALGMRRIVADAHALLTELARLRGCE